MVRGSCPASHRSPIRSRATGRLCSAGFAIIPVRATWRHFAHLAHVDSARLRIASPPRARHFPPPALRAPFSPPPPPSPPPASVPPPARRVRRRHPRDRPFPPLRSRLLPADACASPGWPRPPHRSPPPRAPGRPGRRPASVPRSSSSRQSSPRLPDLAPRDGRARGCWPPCGPSCRGRGSGPRRAPRPSRADVRARPRGLPASGRPPRTSRFQPSLPATQSPTPRNRGRAPAGRCSCPEGCGCRSRARSWRASPPSRRARRWARGVEGSPLRSG